MARNGREQGGVSGLQKAAILLISLGPERSAGIFKHLKEEEIEEDEIINSMKDADGVNLCR